MTSRSGKRAVLAGRTITPRGEEERRSRIIEEHHLRREIEREEKIRRESPDYWRWKEGIRLEGDRADAELNRKLREAGCRPVPRSLSLKEKVKKLQRLEARNRAESASLRSPK